MRLLVRKILIWLFVSVVVAIAVAIAAEWVVEVLRDKGWYANAGDNWDWFFAASRDVATSLWVLLPTCVLAGIVIGLQADSLLRRAQPRASQVPSSSHHAYEPLSAAWANGMIKLSIKDAACALAGTHPDNFSQSPRAKAILNELRADVAAGWIPLASEVDPPNGRTVIVPADKYAPKKQVRDGALVPAFRLRERYSDRDWDTSWIADN